MVNIGDIVVGNGLADKYTYTKPGTYWVVIDRSEPDDQGYDDPVLLAHCNEKGQFLNWNNELCEQKDASKWWIDLAEGCFDLYMPAKKIQQQEFLNDERDLL